MYLHWWKVRLNKQTYNANIFKNEINNIIDVSTVFPSIDNLDVADLVYNVSFLFPLNCNVENQLKDVLCMSSIIYTQEQFNNSIPIIKKFLLKFHSI